MQKILVIAAREYFAVVRSKAFVISLVLLPLMMFAPGVVQKMTSKVMDIRDRKFAVIDHTPGAQMFPALAKAVQRHNEQDIFEGGEQGKQIEPRFVLERIEPAAEGPDLQQEYELAQRVRKGDLFGFVEIGRDVFTAPPAQAGEGSEPKRLKPEETVRYHTSTPTYFDFPQLVTRTVNSVVLKSKLEAAGVKGDFDKLKADVTLVDRGLPFRDAKGTIQPGEETNQLASLLVPFGLVFLMFIVVLIGAIPLTQGIIEEKQQRIAEVLLGSVQPFQLMAGKVLGMVGTSLTLILIYLAGAYFTAQKLHLVQYLPAHVIAWFVVFQILAVLMYGSIYIAIGASCTDAKEMQSLLMPVNLIMVLPLMVLANVVQNPNGPLARLATWFPPATPMIAVARIAVPPGIPAWEKAAAIAIVIAATALFIWASGRIFRVGILMQGKGAHVGEILRWIVSG
jgi:ABC-2 type transport system permease protein